MKFTEKIKNIFLYLGMDKSTYLNIEPQLQIENRKILIFMSAIVFFIHASMTVLNTLSSFLNTSSLFYICGAAVEATIFVFCVTVAKKSHKVMPFLVEINLIMVYALCVGIATFGSTEDEPTVTLFVVMIFMPLLFIGRPITISITNIVTIIVFIILDKFKLSAVFSRDVTNALVYLVLSIALSTWLSQSRAGNKKLLYDLEETRKDLADSYGVVEGLNKEYLALLLVDKQTQEISLVRSTEVDSFQNGLDLFISDPEYNGFFEKYIDSCVAEEDRKRLAEAVKLDAVIKNIENQGIYSINYLRLYNDGHAYYHQLTFANAGSEESTSSFVVGFRDIDALVKKEQEKQQILQDALDAAEHANRAKTTFLNNMSHDIRTPMNAIVGFTALAAAHLDNTEQVQDYLKKITTSSQHLLSLINDVLDMSRIESGKMKIEEKPVHLPDILHDLRNIIQVSASSKQLNLFIDTIDVVNEDVICDPLRLNQVLLNLVSNAIKFTQPGGYVSIHLAQKATQNPKYAEYVFSVKDNGIGMSKEFAEHVFDSFAREESSTVNRIQGTGLGMAITKNIVDMMGGTIKVESEQGVGSEFIVSLPLAVAGEPVTAAPIEELVDTRALVVDDDSDCCISISGMLKQIGLKADWTMSGREAVLRADVAKKQGEPYGVFIIDLVMPDMNGIETVRRIRKAIGNDTPIIVLTAYDWSDVMDEALEAGVTAFCAKPIFMSDLKEALCKPFNKETAPVEEKKFDFAGRRILLAEDNELNREIATTILSATGLIVEEATDGGEALQMVRNADAGWYDMILMDIQMPIMNGYEATKHIRELDNVFKASIPIVAMSANAFEEDKKLAYEAGMNGYLTKPIDINAVMEQLAKILL